MPVSQLFSALLFDLDDTLVASGHLNAACRSGDRDAVSEGLKALSVESAVRATLQSLHGKVPLAVVTASPRWYAELVLKHVLPEVEWKAVVCAGDVARSKPYPDALVHAAKALAATDMRRVAYFGDSKKDVEAAYHAGIRPVLCTWFKRDREAEQLCPDAILRTTSDLNSYLANPAEFLPLIEQAIEAPHCPIWHPRLISVGNAKTKVHTLGRYFPREGDTLTLHQGHALSKQVARKELKEPFAIPEPWTRAAEHAVQRIAEDHESNLVSIVPAKPGRDPRLERLLDAVQKAVAKTFPEVAFSPHTLRFSAASGQVKHKGVTERRAEVEEHLSLNEKVKGKRVILIDDVVTTGGTISTAAELLDGGGASDVRLLGMAKTISAYSFAVTPEEKRCSNCGRFMVRRVRKSDGAPFYGCTGYPSFCQWTEDL